MVPVPLRTGQTDLPHPPLQSVVLPQRGLTELSPGGVERPRLCFPAKRDSPGLCPPHKTLFHEIAHLCSGGIYVVACPKLCILSDKFCYRRVSFIGSTANLP